MDIQHILLTDKHFRDLNPLIAGQEVCKSLHSFGPRVRKYTLIHYVFRGKGTLYARGKAFPVEARQAFLILPGEVTTYTADRQDPWHYCWIGFDGSLSADFSGLPPVFSPPEDIFRDLVRLRFDDSMNEHRVAALLHRLYAELFCRQNSVNLHVQRAKNFIRTSYMQPIGVEDIAAHVSLDRAYLSRLFKDKTGQTVQQYLMGTRLEEGRRHLLQGSSVAAAALACGYEDASTFSKAYKKYFGASPSRAQKETV